MIIRYAVLLLVSLSMIGCTSMRPIAGTPGKAAEKLEAGELIVLHDLSGARKEMYFSEVSNDEIHGTSADGKVAQSVALANIEQIEAKRIDGLRTTLFVIGSAVTLSALVDAIEAAGAGAVLNAGTP